MAAGPCAKRRNSLCSKHLGRIAKFSSLTLVWARSSGYNKDMKQEKNTPWTEREEELYQETKFMMWFVPVVMTIAFLPSILGWF